MARTRQNINYNQASKREQITLAVCSTVMVAFVLFVSIATHGSLAGYTTIHGVLAVVTILILLVRKPKSLVYVGIGVGILGAVSAIWIVLAYLPYYMSYLESI